MGNKVNRDKIKLVSIGEIYDKQEDNYEFIATPGVSNCSILIIIFTNERIISFAHVPPKSTNQDYFNSMTSKLLNEKRIQTNSKYYIYNNKPLSIGGDNNTDKVMITSNGRKIKTIHRAIRDIHLETKNSINYCISKYSFEIVEWEFDYFELCYEDFPILSRFHSNLNTLLSNLNYFETLYKK